MVRADRTPTAPDRPRQQPNRKFEHRAGPSAVVVGTLLIAALVVGVVLWYTLGSDNAGGTVSLPSIVPTSIPGVTVAPAPGQARIVNLSSYDPDGDGNENDDLLSLLVDNDPATSWHTVCYSDRYLGGKQGVGVVLDLGANHTATVSASISSAPYQLKVYTAPDGNIPATFNAWGQPLQSFHDEQPGDIAVAVSAPARFVLLSFVELGTGNNCSANPYRGSIREVAVA